MDISLITPTYNRLEQLKGYIDALEQQDYPFSDFEVVLVSDGSSDGTDEYLHTLKTPLQLRICSQPNSGAAAARNKGVTLARAGLILFIDDDICPDASLVRQHVEMHRSLGPTDILLGPMLTPDDCRLVAWVAWEQMQLEKQYRAMQRGHYDPTGRQFYTGNASLRKQFFVDTGCFDPQFRRGEDVEFAYRAEKIGARFTFAPELRAYHYAHRSYESWKHSAYAYGSNDVRFTREKGIDWLLPQVLGECKRRPVLTRLALRVYLDQPERQARALNFLKSTGEFAYDHGLPVLTRALFSLIFHIRYYQGISDELGGRDTFYTFLKQI